MQQRDPRQRLSGMTKGGDAGQKLSGMTFGKIQFVLIFVVKGATV